MIFGIGNLVAFEAAGARCVGGTVRAGQGRAWQGRIGWAGRSASRGRVRQREEAGRARRGIVMVMAEPP